MPHLILHVSPTLAHHDWQPFFVKAHETLSPYAKISKCKSRLEVASRVHLGEGAPGEALIFLELAVRPRPEAVVKEMGDRLFELLKIESTAVLKEAHLQADPTLEIRILNHYWQD